MKAGTLGDIGRSNRKKRKQDIEAWKIRARLNGPRDRKCLKGLCLEREKTERRESRCVRERKQEKEQGRKRVAKEVEGSKRGPEERLKEKEVIERRGER